MVVEGKPISVFSRSFYQSEEENYDQVAEVAEYMTVG
jgi:hypothetical protein